MTRAEDKQALLILVLSIVTTLAGSAGAQELSESGTDRHSETSIPHDMRPSDVPAGKSPRRGDVKILDLGAGVKMHLVYVPGGSFEMGSPDAEREPITRRLASQKSEITPDILEALKLEGPVHTVEMDGFWMGKFEVTVAQFRQFVEATSHRTDAEKKGQSDGVSSAGGWPKVSGLCWRNPGFPQEDNHPVVQVSWNDAKAFCDWLSRKTGKDVRLPSESEWEYACRAGTRTAYQWGDDPDAGKGWLNGTDATAKREYPSWPCFNFDDGYVYTAPVGSFKANAFGLHDMHGNAWEWCADFYGPKYYAESPRRNPQGPSEGRDRMSRGGSWDYYENLYRSAARVRLPPTSTYPGQGFRVACSRRAGS